MDQSIFKAYDIRGVYPQEINELDVYKIATALCQYLKPTELVVGCDVRLSSPVLKRAAIKAITDQGVKVIDVGDISTDMLYFAVANYGFAGGLTITASHNPKEYNGMKIVKDQSKPISSDSGLFDIRDAAFSLEINEDVLKEQPNESLIEKKDILADYAQKVRSFADLNNLKKFKIVVNPNFGVGGRALDTITEGLDLELIKINYNPDGNFPKGRPDPLIPENREEISKLVQETGADLGVAWDADADRCFFFTEKGEFIEGYFITALIAKIFLTRNANNEKIVHDTRLTWAIEDMVKQFGANDISTKAGHSFIKERMRKENAIFGGEMSAHYYFRDYFFCDCGMIPFVMMLELLSKENKPLSELMQDFWNTYYVSGEINTQVANVPAVIEKIKSLFISDATKIDEQDGISLDFEDAANESNSWRFSVRGSNTEPLIRLNVEAKSQSLMKQKRDELLAIIRG